MKKKNKARRKYNKKNFASPYKELGINRANMTTGKGRVDE